MAEEAQATHIDWIDLDELATRRCSSRSCGRASTSGPAHAPPGAATSSATTLARRRRALDEARGAGRGGDLGRGQASSTMTSETSCGIAAVTLMPSEYCPKRDQEPQWIQSGEWLDVGCLPKMARRANGG